MKKTSKGVIAVGAAVMLLLGGGGTLAYWNSSANLGGASTITAGTLTVAANGNPSWTIKHTSGVSQAVPDISSVRIVPGDVLEYSIPATITAQGDNLRFKVESAAGAITGQGTEGAALAARLQSATSFAVTGATPVTGQVNTFDHKSSSAGTYQTTITATITWPFGDQTSPTADNPAKEGAVDLSQFALTVTQVDGSI